jgi:hypothetical protein
MRHVNDRRISERNGRICRTTRTTRTARRSRPAPPLVAADRPADHRFSSEALQRRRSRPLCGRHAGSPATFNLRTNRHCIHRHRRHHPRRMLGVPDVRFGEKSAGRGRHANGRLGRHVAPPPLR